MINEIQRATIVGVFTDRSHADQAIRALHDAGFRDDQIGVAMRHPSETRSDEVRTTDYDEQTGAEYATGSHVSSGAVAGVLTGLGLGALAGLGVLSGFIPVIGPAIAGGTLGVILSNAAAGAGVAGLAGALIGSGIPEEEANYYQNEFEAGRTIVTVQADGRTQEATAILRRFGAYDVSTRGSKEAHTGSPSQADSFTTEAAEMRTAGPRPIGEGATKAEAATAGRESEAGQHFKVKEEQLQAEKRPVEAGQVRVRKEAHTEHQAIDVPVHREEVIIERRPGHGQDAPEGLRADDLDEGKEIRIPVRQEQVDVTKKAVVREEVSVGKRAVQDTKRVEGDVRKEELHVEREGDVDVDTGQSGSESR